MDKHRHFIIHKPFGYISQFIHNENKRRNKKLLGEIHEFPEGTMAIGRLDKDSEGLLFLTTDGKVSEQVRSKKVEKEYYIQLDGYITDEAIERLMLGVEIGFKKKIYTTLPCFVKRLDPIPNFEQRTKKIRDERHGVTSWISIVITEGKFRQVRKMSASVGFPTLRLIRVRIGNMSLGNLSSGQIIEVDNFSIPGEKLK
jgi:23S rRNA pseudouridine2457 synthase